MELNALWSSSRKEAAGCEVKDVDSSFIHHFQPWKRPRCPSVGERVNALRSNQTMG